MLGLSEMPDEQKGQWKRLVPLVRFWAKPKDRLLGHRGSKMNHKEYSRFVASHVDQMHTHALLWLQ